VSDLLAEPVPARDLVLRKLRDAILSGRFVPGQRLVERELVALTGVSRTPIREALRKLELEGLVTTVPYRGPVVTLPTVDDARDLYEARAALEGQVVALCTARGDPAVLQRLRAHVARAEAAAATDDPAGVLAANNAFHDTLTAACGNAVLEQMIMHLRNRIVLLRVQSLSYPGRPRRSVREHQAILRWMAQGNAAGARRLMEQHVLHAWKAARAQLRASPDAPDGLSAERRRGGAR
jgi:DNA-binding GntR family transcriptional regulator